MTMAKVLLDEYHSAIAAGVPREQARAHSYPRGR